MLLGSSGNGTAPVTNVFGLSNGAMKIDSPKVTVPNGDSENRSNNRNLSASGFRNNSPISQYEDTRNSNGTGARQTFNNNAHLSSLVMDFISQSSDTDSTIIDLSHRSIDIRALTLIARKCKSHLRSTLAFKLSFNQLKDEGVQLLVEYASKENRKINVLDIAFNDVGDQGAEALANATCLDGSLQTLCLSGNRLTQQGFQKLCEKLRRSKTLTSLYCSGNSGKQQGAEYIATVLSSRLVPLKVFWFDGNNIKSEGARAVGQGLSQNISLEHLNLSNNSIEDAGCEYIASSLEKQRQLKDLYLSFNGITATGLHLLTNALINYHTLMKLDLDNNKIGDDGAEHLADALGHMSLSILNVAYNNITTRGIKCIVESLVINPALQYLSLSGNDINIDSGIAIHNLLLYNRTLKALYVDSQSIGEAGQRQIASSIASNAHGGLLDFSGFSLGPHMVQLGGPAELKDLSNEDTLQYLQKLWSSVDSSGGTSGSTDNDKMLADDTQPNNTASVMHNGKSSSDSYSNINSDSGIHLDQTIGRANMYPHHGDGYGFNKMGGPGPYFGSHSTQNSDSTGLDFDDDIQKQLDQAIGNNPGAVLGAGLGTGQFSFLNNVKGMSNSSMHTHGFNGNTGSSNGSNHGSNASSVNMKDAANMMMTMNGNPGFSDGMLPNPHNPHNPHNPRDTNSNGSNSNAVTTENSTRSNSSVELLELLNNVISDSDITNILNVSNGHAHPANHNGSKSGLSRHNSQSVNLAPGIAMNSNSTDNNDNTDIGPLGRGGITAIADSEKHIEAMIDKEETLGGSRSRHGSHSSALQDDSDDGEGHEESMPRTSMLNMSAMPSVNVFSFATNKNKGNSDWDRVLNAAKQSNSNSVDDSFANLSEPFIITFRNISKEPYAASELWELHQYYHSYARVDESDTASTSTSDDEMDEVIYSNDRRHVPGSRKTLREGSDRAEMSSKRNKKSEARIARYPRIQMLLDTFKRRNEDSKMLTLLRQLHFLERVKESELDPGTDIEQLLFHIR